MEPHLWMQHSQQPHVPCGLPPGASMRAKRTSPSLPPLLDIWSQQGKEVISGNWVEGKGSFLGIFTF